MGRNEETWGGMRRRGEESGEVRNIEEKLRVIRRSRGNEEKWGEKGRCRE